MCSETTNCSRWTRRAFIGTLMTPFGYVAYRVAAHNQWIIVTRGRRAFDKGIEPARLTTGKQFSMLIVGDTGLETTRREAVVKAMRRHATWSNPDAVMLLGDNFYERGVTSVDDPQFDVDFESLFDVESFDVPFYACLGNHDVQGNPEAQVQYSERSERWTMPSRYYRCRRMVGHASIDIFVLDTNELLGKSHDADQQLQWLRNELAASRADFKIVVGHHPVITGGQHEVAAHLERVLPPLFDQFGIDAYLSGHDHDLQLLRSDAGWLQVVSGSGSKLRSTAWIDKTLFADATSGFCWLLVDESGLSISYYDSQERLFTYRASKDRNPKRNKPDFALGRTTKSIGVG